MASAAEMVPDRSAMERPSANKLLKLASLELCALDFLIALLRKAGGFCAMVMLGWLSFRQLAFGQSLHQIYPDAPDPELRQTIMVALLLVVAQGWDISNENLRNLQVRFLCHFPVRPAEGSGLYARTFRFCLKVSRWCGASVKERAVRGVHILDLCVVTTNKLGALVGLGYLTFLFGQFWWLGDNVHRMYPSALDPMVSLLAQVCVYAVILSWWTTPLEQLKGAWMCVVRGKDSNPQGTK